jgi:dipeptidyl aminopeptidase/acylaminoacyl peptidase
VTHRATSYSTSVPPLEAFRDRKIRGISMARIRAQTVSMLRNRAASKPETQGHGLKKEVGMRIRQLWTPLFVTCCGLCTLLAASTGPDDRPLTDPKSVVSSSNAAARPAPIEDLYFTKSVFGAAWSPDGKQIAFTSDIAGRPNLWKVIASGGWPIQLTQSDERQYNAAWSPDGQWIVYQQDHAGDELWDLYAVPSDGGEIVNLTNTPAIREQDPHWSHDGRTIAFAYKPKEGSQYDIALLNWSTRKVQLLTHEQQPGFPTSLTGC